MKMHFSPFHECALFAYRVFYIFLCRNLFYRLRILFRLFLWQPYLSNGILVSKVDNLFKVFGNYIFHLTQQYI